MESKSNKIEKSNSVLAQFFVFWVIAQTFYAIYFFGSEKGMDINFLDRCTSVFVGMTVTSALSFVLFILYKSART